VIAAWTPGLGDPGARGWLTVAAYAVTAVLLARASLRDRRAGAPEDVRPARFWTSLAVAVAFMGVVKLLDLASGLTDAARTWVAHQNWDDSRRSIQFAAVALAVLLVTIGVVALDRLRRSRPRGTSAALVGSAALFAFIAVRAVSFHELDDGLSGQLAGLSVNFVIEVGLLAIIAFGAVVAARQPTV
jgi:hypothetical protein